MPNRNWLYSGERCPEHKNFCQDYPLSFQTPFSHFWHCTQTQCTQCRLWPKLSMSKVVSVQENGSWGNHYWTCSGRLLVQITTNSWRYLSSQADWAVFLSGRLNLLYEVCRAKVPSLQSAQHCTEYYQFWIQCALVTTTRGFISKTIPNFLDQRPSHSRPKASQLWLAHMVMWLLNNFHNSLLF